MSENQDQTQIIPYDENFIKKAEEFKRAWAGVKSKISKTKTIHRKKSRKIAENKWEDYLPIQYMTALLDKHYPGWSLYSAHPPLATPLKQGQKFLIVAGLDLEIIDEFKFKFLVAIGVPPEVASYTRNFYGMGGGMYHASEKTGNVIHNSNPAKIAVSEGLKFCINRLTGIGNDTYKREEEALTLEEYTELRTLIEESNMSEEDKRIAREKLNEINSKQVESLKQIIIQKEAENVKNSSNNKD